MEQDVVDKGEVNFEEFEEEVKVHEQVLRNMWGKRWSRSSRRRRMWRKKKR